MGDSVTAGNASTSGTGYRPTVNAWAALQGYVWTPVGTTSGAAGAHEGHTGSTVDPASGSPLPPFIASVYPSSIPLIQLGLLYIGINDCILGGAGFNAATCASNMAAFLSQLYLVDKNTQWVVSKLFRNGNAQTNTNRNALNALLPAVWNTYDATANGDGKPRLIRADMDAAIEANGGASLIADGTHPNDAGYAVMANEWIRALST
jgi:lysophospholipase L1-like esterase